MPGRPSDGSETTNQQDDEKNSERISLQDLSTVPAPDRPLSPTLRYRR
jgi:hypothetical protein